MKTNSHNQNRFLIAFLALAGISSVLWVTSHYTGMAVHPYTLAGLRWAAIVAVIGYASLRRSLTAWIFAGMVVGAETGFDLTFASDATRLKVAADLQVLSAIFLRLI
ncbi:MAG: dicarboxylate/amino acid:cation symporter, partial [Candidatus Angelobacter sp.]|nr:dicarboxylate/amino acid:cation symporter [Candidatus Angelobacter sp.]